KMKKYYPAYFIFQILFSSWLFLNSSPSFSQNSSGHQSTATHPVFPQQKINKALIELSQQETDPGSQNVLKTTGHQSGAFNVLKLSAEWEQPFDAGNITGKVQQAPDTIFVGDVPNDTLIITGTWTNNGPVLVFNDGVLIFQNANATVIGNMYVFQGGKLWADSSTLFFPQQYFYQRSLVVADSAFAQFDNCTLDYGGYSHSLMAAGSSTIIMNDVHNNDWTTAGAYGNSTITINGTNLGGEYILSDHANFNFSNVTTLLLWHYFPDTAVINYSFPPGDTVNSYTCSNSTPGITGIGYNVQADSCYNVWWGMMPVNGSDVTISNSVIRAIGAWFQFGDSVHVSGLVNNSSYTNFVAPLPDRNLHLINSDVQTWSLYIFDSSEVNITGCILGEVGSMGRSYVTASSMFCDGSGGYLWATDTSVTIASGSSATTTVRSERNGFMIYGYGSISNGTADAINNSLLIVVQSNLPQDPTPYDGSVAWFGNINGPATGFVNSSVTVIGSAWIDQGPLGSWMDFGLYKLYYNQGAGAWTAIDTGSTTEVSNAPLATWNTSGLTPGSYTLHLVLFNDLGDSVEATKPIILLPSILSVDEQQISESVRVFPNPSGSEIVFKFNLSKDEPVQLFIYDASGKIIKQFRETNFAAGEHQLTWEAQNTTSGIYYYRFFSPEKTENGKIELSGK
ncbi:MAG TPA: T9SS type A sorting domain-containing protein, partial [Bacteroidia bacterium]|nr:T9SS type A sorting domain-containing protein [Bacteroidia bacterium]